MSRRLILVVEDDAHIRRGLVDALESEGYATAQAADGKAALAHADLGASDLILLDIMMPEQNGYEVCREIRRRSIVTPVIFLTAKGEEIDKVVGLQIGADDYITKPFGVRELLARVDAVLRRCRPPVAVHGRADVPPVLFFAGLEVNRRKYTIGSGARSERLTARELKLIETFEAHPGEVLSRDDLLNAVWGVEYYGTTRTLDQHMAQLRKKVEKDPAHPQHLVTVHGIGYRYEP